MTDQVTFDESVGGDGTVITNDRNPTTGIKGGGHIYRFVKALSQLVAVCAFTVGKCADAVSAAATAVNAKLAAEQAAADATAAAEGLEAAVLAVENKLDDDFGNVAGTLAVANGGTGETSLAAFKTALDLDAVDNTADADKPVSTLQAAADAAVLSSAQSYADGLVVGLVEDRGSYDPAAGTALGYPISTSGRGGSGAGGAIKQGDLWFCSSAGTVNGESVQVGTSVRALVDNPGNTPANWSTISTTLGFTPENSANKSTS
jgi:hypothetical protein